MNSKQPKIGDEVVLHPAYSSRPVFGYTIKAISPSGQITIEKGGEVMRFTGNSHRLIGEGASPWNCTSISFNADEQKAASLKQETRLKAGKAVNSVKEFEPARSSHSSYEMSAILDEIVRKVQLAREAVARLRELEQNCDKDKGEA